MMPAGRHCRKAMTRTKTSTFATEALSWNSSRALAPPIATAAMAVPTTWPMPPRMTTRKESTMY